MPIDYSKWKDIEVSDDEDDTHPNVDTPSLFRWRHQARVERMEERKHEKQEIEMGKTDSQRKMEEIQRKLEQTELDEKERIKLELEKQELAKQEEEYRKKEKELADKERLEPWNVDTIGHESWSKSRINKYSDKKPAPPKLSEDQEADLMRDFFNKYDEEIKKYGQLKGFDASEKYILDNPHLACDFTANFLTLECLNLGMEFKDEEMCNMAEQCIVIQYLIELAKTLGSPPTNTSVIRNFFKKIKAADPSYLKMFRSEVEAFQDRIRKRAKDKRDAAIAEMEKEEREKRIAASPGGVDPQEVYESLPEKMREAFDSQDVSQLQKVAEEMDKEEFAKHLKLCIASGLWVPDANKDKAEAADVAEEQDDDDESHYQQPGDAAETPEPKKDR